jgi:hypothetical protein
MAVRQYFQTLSTPTVRTTAGSLKTNQRWWMAAFFAIK